ncbi:signal peptide peptidase-domain-containing protein [Mycena alexandri]|uniref:Signal peptide peptidase-domain-containing protein n=1 Tax=Mycena alexandri TaxID=1745969 RepID=A0AAD6XHL8_9AGAR|nr:signal peptide peptidase-domain-containing protein [Mycena alexandri]
MDYDLLSSYAGLLSLATASIYFGAHGSLPPPRNADGSRNEEAEAEELPDRLSSGDAYLFPIIGSATLVGMYAVVVYFGTGWINWLLGHYLAIVGVGAVWKTLIGLARYALGPTRWKSFDLLALVIRRGSGDPTKRARPPLVDLSLRTPSLLLLPLALLPSALYTFHARTALLTDILALAMAHNALGLIKLDSFATGCILLTGLFFYDIWWVFGTEVMVKVATSLDVPIKLVWPKSLPFVGGGGRGYTMLGLGDVVIPGVFVALALRYDHHRATSASGPVRGTTSSTFGKPYFYAALGAYVAGLVTTMGVMHLFGKAQPALLYLSPACMGAFGITGAVRGELGAAWGWSDEADEDEGKADEKKADESAPVGPEAE